MVYRGMSWQARGREVDGRVQRWCCHLVLRLNNDVLRIVEHKDLCTRESPARSVWTRVETWLVHATPAQATRFQSLCCRKE